MQELRDAVCRAFQTSVVCALESDQICAAEVAAQDRSRSAGRFQEVGEPVCPFFRKAAADWLYPVTGYCRGRPDGKLMIPSIREYRERCTTKDFLSCETCQAERQILHNAAT